MNDRKEAYGVKQTVQLGEVKPFAVMLDSGREQSGQYGRLRASQSVAGNPGAADSRPLL